jgi:6-phosphogluconate dehydrogenase
MKFGIIGLGRMGGGLAQHAIELGYQVVGYAPSEKEQARLACVGLQPAASLDELVAALESPRIILLYVPHGDPTEAVCHALRPRLAAGDVVADGGNSRWTDSARRHAWFAETGVRFLDVGTSGGVSGALHGACFMVGGDRLAYDLIYPILRDLAIDPAGAYYVGPPGSGHFAKLIHNGIEFGMVQAIAEGVELLQRSDYPIDLEGLFDNWMHGSVIRSWLVELMGKALAKNPDFSELSTYVEDTGEVKWVLDWALEKDIPTPVVSLAQTMLMQYRDVECPAAKAVALLRNQFGGHPVHRKVKATKAVGASRPEP